ncbi:putative terpene cyclase [Sistotremastrum suecicum HHB10207 ss-3]|uniref:Terpene synthase n=1 Tax=Sistotremastrum suecicum HHB10207 ss-3 TaxID=1314776 RepID=A0A165Z3N0_9AGAM|nr:putative terpene cyclase [Sistotremastrum suecicum HHB10207 ss-3]
MSTTTIQLPDLFENLPSERSINPHYEPIASQSASWLESFGLLDSKTCELFRRCKPGLLVALAYPHFNPDHLRIAMDMMNCSLYFDERSDARNADEVREDVEIVMDVLRNPEKVRPEGEDKIGVLYQSFWTRALQSASPSSARRFIKSYHENLIAVISQAQDRELQTLHTLESFLPLRRMTVGLVPCLDFLQLEMDIPDELVEHQSILELVECANDLIVLENDICSYNVEQARSDSSHNILTIISHQLSLSLPEALLYVGTWHHTLTLSFLSKSSSIPFSSFPPECRRDVEEYVWGIGNWVRANVEWSFETERYFGKRGGVVAEERLGIKYS